MPLLVFPMYHISDAHNIQQQLKKNNAEYLILFLTLKVTLLH